MRVRIGLLTPGIRPKFEELGILSFESLPDDADTSWEALSAPLYEQEVYEQEVIAA